MRHQLTWHNLVGSVVGLLQVKFCGVAGQSGGKQAKEYLRRRQARLGWAGPTQPAPCTTPVRPIAH